MILFKSESILKSSPRHIAIIMDGNARWAKKRGLSVEKGHRAGAEALRKILYILQHSSTKYLTVYAFSSENWGRPDEEVNHLMNLIVEYLEREQEAIKEKKIKIHFLGDLSKLDQKTAARVMSTQESTRENNGFKLNIALSYGARDEIIRACNKAKDNITEEKFEKLLDTVNSPAPDLLIRTGGNIRISNFLLWQIAYTELYFTKTLWPDFGKKALLKAINEFNKRERNYGKR